MFAETGAAKNNQACAPFPERDRSIATGTRADRHVSANGDVLLPRAPVKIHRQKPTGLVLEQWIDAHHVPTLQMLHDQLLVHGDEGLVGAIAAFAARLEKAEFREPLIRASWRVAAAASFLAHKT